MTHRLRHIALCAVVIAGSFSAAITAQSQSDRKLLPLNEKVVPVTPLSSSWQPPMRHYAQNKISYAQAKSIAERRVPGAKVVDISLNGNTYRVRMERRDGRVVDVYIDAVTGRVR